MSATNIRQQLSLVQDEFSELNICQSFSLRIIHNVQLPQILVPIEKTTESIFPVWHDLPKKKKKYCDIFLSFYFSAFNVNLDTVYVISLPEPNPQVSLSDHVYLVFCWCHCRWYCLNCFGQSVLYLQFHILLIH